MYNSAFPNDIVEFNARTTCRWTHFISGRSISTSHSSTSGDEAYEFSAERITLDPSASEGDPGIR